MSLPLSSIKTLSQSFTEESLWEFIPKEEMLKDGIYFLLASRDPEKGELPGDTAFRLKKLAVTDRYRPQRMGAENTAFLKRYIKRAGLKELEEELFIKLNESGLGPMGLGGASTVLGVRIKKAYCHTASLPVAVNIGC